MSEAAIDLHACVHNCRTLRALAGSRKLFAVVKANAYGHGMLPVAEALAGEADGFCVFTPAEAVQLAGCETGKPVYAMGGFADASQLDALASAQAWITVHTSDQVRLLAESPSRFGRVFVKVNTGMNRLGFRPEDAADAVRQIGDAAAQVSLMTHFASADEPDGARHQADRFADLVAQLGLAATCSNTAATVLQETLLPAEEFVRCGIGLYGASPVANRPASDFGLKPAMALRAPVLAVQKLEPGECVGYGCAWRAAHRTAIAIVGIGYADGYPRAAAGAPAIVGERRGKVVGRVSMDMTAIETGLPACQVGEIAQMWGSEVPVDEVAACAGTIGYELLARLAVRVPRTYA